MMRMMMMMMMTVCTHSFALSLHFVARQYLHLSVLRIVVLHVNLEVNSSITSSQTSLVITYHVIRSLYQSLRSSLTLITLHTGQQLDGNSQEITVFSHSCNGSQTSNSLKQVTN